MGAFWGPKLDRKLLQSYVVLAFSHGISLARRLHTGGERGWSGCVFGQMLRRCRSAGEVGSKMIDCAVHFVQREDRQVHRRFTY